MAYAGVIGNHLSYGARYNIHPPILYEGPNIIDSHLTNSTLFSFVDFLPVKDEREGPLPFSTILMEANVWLAKHLQYEAIKCESIIVPFESHEIANSDYCVIVPDRIRATVNFTKKWSYVRSLRLWVRKRDAENQVKIAQIIDMMDFRPNYGRGTSMDSEAGKEGGSDAGDSSEREDGSPFGDGEKLADLVNRINEAVKQGKLTGRIICVESLDCEATSSGRVTSPEDTLIKRHDGYVRGLRVFYEESHTEIDEEICIKDFVPKYLGGGSIIRRPTFESVEQVLFQVAKWLSFNPEVKVLNMQTLESKLSLRTNIDTERLVSSKKGDQIRHVRLAYLKSPNSKSRCSSPIGDSISVNFDAASLQPPPSEVASSITQYSGSPPSAPLYIASKLFVPTDDSDKLPNIERRLQDFIKEMDPSDLRLLTAETVCTYMKSLGNKKRIEASFDHTFQSSRFGCVEMVFGIRFYYDEGYFEFKKREASRAKHKSAKDQRGDYYMLSGPDAADLDTRSLYLGAESRDDLFSEDGDADGFKLRKRTSCGVS